MHSPSSARPWTSWEMAAMVRLAPPVLTVLVFAPTVVPERESQVREIVTRLGCRLILRPYVPTPIRTYAGRGLEWGETCAEWIAPYLDMMPDAVLDNEPNLEGGCDDPIEIGRFWVDSVDGFHDAVPLWTDVLMPPLAPVGNYRALYSDLIEYDTHNAFQRLAAHVYARADNWDDPAWLAQQTGMPVDVTEWDSWTPHGYLDLDSCLAMMHPADAKCWFALSGDDPAFANYYWLPNEAAILKGGGEMASNTERIALLEKQQGLTLDLLQRILEGKWDATYGASSAEALIRSFNPKYENVVALPFPSGQ
jgi:hypothetical protein